MQSVGTGLSNLLGAMSPEQAKAARIARNNARFKAAVLRTWADSPDVAHFLLAHTSSLYFKKDESLRTGPASGAGRFEMGVYFDDPMARAEFNARREVLRIGLAQEGIRTDGIVIHASRNDMRGRHLFPDSVARTAQALGGTPPPPQPHAPARDGAADAQHGRALAKADQSDLLEAFKRACCLSFGKIEMAEALLDKVRGAAMVEAPRSRTAKQSRMPYTCHLYVGPDDEAAMRAVVEANKETIVSSAKRLKLLLRDIAVHTNPLVGEDERAFPRAGKPMPLKNLDLQELKAEQARMRERIRAKVGKAR